jgi:hypothetical protein
MGRGSGRSAGRAVFARGAQHLVAEAEVEGFLADSLFREPLWHCTTPDRPESIRRAGPDLRAFPGTYGYGLWLATSPEVEPHRPEAMQVAARIRNPIPPGRFGDPLETITAYRRRAAGELGRDATKERVAERVTELVLADGYDALVQDMGDTKWLVVYDPDALRVVLT